MKNLMIILSAAISGAVLVILFFKGIDYNFGEWGGIAIGAISGGVFATIANKYLIDK